MDADDDAERSRARLGSNARPMMAASGVANLVGRSTRSARPLRGQMLQQLRAAPHRLQVRHENHVLVTTVKRGGGQSATTQAADARPAGGPRPPRITDVGLRRPPHPARGGGSSQFMNDGPSSGAIPGSRGRRQVSWASSGRIRRAWNAHAPSGPGGLWPSPSCGVDHDHDCS